jgi:hypothetical protein
LNRETFVEQSKNPPKFAFKLNKLVLHPEWTVSQLALVPADDATRNALEVYRKSISDAVGMEGNSSYQFHITLMYQNKQVPPEQRPEVRIGLLHSPIVHSPNLKFLFLFLPDGQNERET